MLDYLGVLWAKETLCILEGLTFSASLGEIFGGTLNCLTLSACSGKKILWIFGSRHDNFSQNITQMVVLPVAAKQDSKHALYLQVIDTQRNFAETPLFLLPQRFR